MKKVFWFIVKTLGLILLVGIVVFICFGIFGPKTNHAGNWQVVKIDNHYIDEDVSMTYSFFADDVATQTVMSGDKVAEIRFFELKRDGDNVKLTIPDKPGGKSYQITIFEDEEGKWMQMKSRTESLIMKRKGGYLVSGLNKSDAEFLYKPHLFVEVEKDKKYGTMIQFFPNSYCKIDTRYGKERYYKFDYDRSENCVMIHMEDGGTAIVKLLSKESCILYDKNDHSISARIYPFESW